MIKRVSAWLLMMLLCMPLAAHADGARASLDRDAMQLGETVTLNIEIDSNSGIEPDFSALTADFNTLGTQSSRQFSMTNGEATAKTVWAIGLEPKRAGTLVIPALTIGSTSTQPLRLTVLPAAAGGQGKAGDDLYIEVSADPLSPYVQQQVRYVVKLFYALNLTEGALDEPTVDGIVVQKLGRDRQYNATIGQSRYHVLERHYALIPERSGALTMPALSFRGSTLDTSDPTGFFRRGRAVTARSEPVELNVRSKPADWGTAAWLPATTFSITDETDLPTQVTVGEPITRTVHLRAQGLGYEQLPELSFNAPRGSEIYPDKSDTKTQDDGSWLYGERTRKFAVVPSQPGKLVLPAIQVDWWDTAADRKVTAVLPAHEIEVLAAAGAAAIANPTPSVAGAAPNAVPAVVYPSQPQSGFALRAWRALAIAAMVLWAITLALWWRARRSPLALAAARAPAVGTPPGRAEFLRACSLGDLAGAERALVAWARSERPALRNLGEIAAGLGAVAQRDLLNDLERVRYAGANVEGLANRLERAFRAGLTWNQASSSAPASSALPKLYPD